MTRIPQFRPHSGSKPESAAGGTRHHNSDPDRESPRDVLHLAPRGGFLARMSEPQLWLLIFGLVLACMVVAGL